MASTATPSPLPRILHIVENSLTVQDVAITDLWYVDPSWSPVRAREEMLKEKFDAAPLDDPQPHRYVEPAWLVEARTIEEVAKPIDTARLVTADLGLADSIVRLRDSAFYFVLDRSRLFGIVTRADLVSPPVGMVTLSLILAAEAGLDLLIRKRLPDDGWKDHLSDLRLSKCEETLALRKQYNVETTLVDCLMLADRLTIIGANPYIRKELGFASGSAFKRFARRVDRVRNELAHGESILSSLPDPVEAIELFTAIRGFAKRVWAVEGLLD